MPIGSEIRVFEDRLVSGQWRVESFDDEGGGCVAISCASRPASTATRASAEEVAGWQPEHAEAPTGGSKEPANAAVTDNRTVAAETKAGSNFWPVFTERAAAI
jgi:hypothetical protein